jgi:hypothetical protein
LPLFHWVISRIALPVTVDLISPADRDRKRAISYLESLVGSIVGSTDYL